MHDLDTASGHDALATDLGSAARLAPAVRPSSAARLSSVDAKCPASFAQQRLWMLDRLLPEATVYIEPKAYRLRGVLNETALQAAVDELVARHQSLRTRFAFEEHGPVQVIAAQLRVRVARVDLAGLAPERSAAEARRLAREEAQTPFDLERGPLMRVRVLRLQEREHWLLLTLHHIITDGWSSGVLLRELSVLYGAHCRGEASALPVLALQYADYAVWQRERLQGKVLEQQLSYWKPMLSELPALELPTDRPRPAIASFRGDHYAFELEPELTQALRKLSRREGVTLFMTLLAAFQVLLYRYSGQYDIAIGVPSAGRTRPELEGLIGFFVNTLVLRGDLSAEPSFTAYLARVRARALEAYAHQDLPFEKLVEELHPKRDLSRNPLFQVSLNFRNVPAGELELDGLAAERIEGASSESAKFDLSVGITERGGDLSVTAVYATDLFDRSTIGRMMGHWRVLLAGIVADPAQSIARLPLLTEQERRELAAEWNATASPYRCDRHVHELFEEQAERTPQAVAVVIGEQQLAYAELNARANQLAHWLRAAGVRADMPVGVCVDRSVELVVGLLGILKAGGAYVPLDPSYPAQRLALMLEDTRAAVLLTSERWIGRLPRGAGQTLCLDSEWAAKVAGQPATDARVPVRACDLAYVSYTSGSTGTPKGVMIEHGSIVNHIAAMLRRFAPGKDDCVLQTAPIGFDQSVWQILVPLVSGGRIALLDTDAHRSPEQVVAAIQRERVTILRIVPTMVAALASQPGLACCKTLRLVICAGEVLDPHVVAEFGARCSAVLVNAYGPTETTFVATMWTCDAERDAQRIPIGAPIDNVRTYVVDRHDQPVPIGVRGELCIGGAGVGRGYWRSPELSARSFVADPFSAVPGARMYRTGDRALRRADGSLEFCGRSDRQVKLRGIRIELGEIEAALLHHDDVTGVAVVVRDDDPDDKRLVAYFVAQRERAPRARELRDFLSSSLPDYMIPAAFVRLPEFPLTPNGKIDWPRLPPPDGQSLAVDPRFVAPRNAVETGLADIFAEALSVDRIGVHDDFFALGGHSLLAMRALAAVKAAFGVTVSPRAFFANATVAGLARGLAGAGARRDASGAVRDRRGPRELPIARNPRSAGRARRADREDAT